MPNTAKFTVSMLIFTKSKHPAALLAACFLVLTTSVRAEVVQVDNAEMQKLQELGVPLIDVRTPEEWNATGVIEGSHLITFFNEQGRYNLDQWLVELDRVVAKDQPFMLICQVGGRTRVISDFLTRTPNYAKVMNVTKGIAHWIKDGRKTIPAKSQN